MTRAVILWAFVLAGCDVTVTLHAGVTEAEANTTIAALHAHQIAASKHPHTSNARPPTFDAFDVTVLSSEVARAVAVLQTTAELPSAAADLRDHPTSSIPTPAEEQARLATTSAAALERTLSLLDGVVAVRALVVLGQRGPTLGAPATPPRAVVTIKHVAGRPPAQATLLDLIAHSVDGLAASDIKLVLVPAVANTPTPLVQVGPIAVTPGSAHVLKIVLVAILVVTTILAGLVLWLRTRR